MATCHHGIPSTRSRWPRNMAVMFGRRRFFNSFAKLFVLMILLVTWSSILNFLCITSVCDISEPSRHIWSDFGDVVVEANVVSPPTDTRNTSSSRLSYGISNEFDKEQKPQDIKLDVDKRLKMLNRQSLDFCSKEKTFADDSRIAVGRREISVKKFLAVGIPSITRSSVLYLNETLTSIFGAIKEDEEKHVTIVVFLADLDRNTREKQATYLSRMFKKALSSGMLHIIQAPSSFYKPLENVHSSLGDNMNRVTWRSKQALDYSFLMCYCSTLSQYYLQLEDDVLASPSFVSKIIDFVGSREGKWISLNVAHLGYIGKLYSSTELPNLASYIYLFYNDMPVDWLEPRWKAYRGFDPSKTEKRPAPLFQHIGLFSSFRYKESQRVNHLKEKYFDVFDHKFRGQNPPADISSDLLSYVGKPLDAYTKGDGYFWGYCRSAGSKVYQILLKRRADLRRVVVNTGSYIATTNFIIKGSLEVSRDVNVTNPKQCLNFVPIGEFSFGQIDVNEIQKNVMCVRIKIRYQGRGIFFREINIWT